MNAQLPFATLAHKLCKQSTHKQHHHGVLVVRGGAIVAMGYNRNPIHAEVHGLKKLWPDHRKGVTVYSFRFLKSGGWAMAKPCPSCEAYMRKNGVKLVYYTDKFGKLIKMKL